MGLSTTATVSTTKEVKLEPNLARQLRMKLREYQAVADQLKTLEHAKDKLKDQIGLLRDETGEMSVSLDGYTVTLVAPERKVLNHKKLIALGCAAAWIEGATEIKLSKAYTKITPPGKKDEEDE